MSFKKEEADIDFDLPEVSSAPAKPRVHQSPGGEGVCTSCES